MSAAQTHLSAVPNEQAAFTQIYDCWGRNYNTVRRKNILPQGQRCYECLKWAQPLLQCVNIVMHDKYLNLVFGLLMLLWISSF